MKHYSYLKRLSLVFIALSLFMVSASAQKEILCVDAIDGPEFFSIQNALNNPTESRTVVTESEDMQLFQYNSNFAFVTFKQLGSTTGGSKLNINVTSGGIICQ